METAEGESAGIDCSQLHRDFFEESHEMKKNGETQREPILNKSIRAEIGDSVALANDGSMGDCNDCNTSNPNLSQKFVLSGTEKADKLESPEKVEEEEVKDRNSQTNTDNSSAPEVSETKMVEDSDTEITEQDKITLHEKGQINSTCAVQDETNANQETSTHVSLIDEDIPMEEEEILPMPIQASHSQQKLKFHQPDFTQELFQYSSITVRVEDYKCLDHTEMLSNTILDFYIHYIHQELMSEELREKVHVLDTSFYSLLSIAKENVPDWNDRLDLSAPKKRYQLVNGLPCLSNVNLFEKDFIVIPCIEKEHWFLAIVCYPKLAKEVSEEETEEPIRPCILVFDSAFDKFGRDIGSLVKIRNFLATLYDAQNYKEQFEFNASGLIGSSVVCPQQTNVIDCGLFVLEFIEHFFIKSPIEALDLPIHRADWFDPDIVKQKRSDIALLVIEKAILKSHTMPILPLIKVHHVDMI